MKEKYLDHLLALTEQKHFNQIKLVLEDLPKHQKGYVFEEYLTKLLRGNGWIAVRKGGRNDKGADILLFHPQNPNKVLIIVQAKNHKKPLSFDDTRIELIKFEKEASSKYKCNQFCLISINGFVNGAKKLSEFNMLLQDWKYVKKLIENYDPRNIKEPKIELFAHNKNTYEKIKRMLKKSNQLAIIQATGTGKSYLIAKVLSDFLNKKKLVMAPSNYILNQLKEKIIWANETVTYMTYAKSMYLSLNEIENLDVDIIILDEFHRCGAEKWGEGVQKILRKYDNAIVIGTSATPIRYLDGSRDMSDELFDGKIASNLRLAQAIIKRILPMPKYISALYTLKDEVEDICKLIINSNESDSNKKKYLNSIKKAEIDWENTSSIPCILKKYIEDDMTKFIVFCENEQQLDEMEWIVQSWFQKSRLGKKRKVYRVISNDPESDSNLEEFKNSKAKNTIHLLFCIDMLNEGIHIDDVSGVILLRRTASPRIFYQQIGRCIQVGGIKRPIVFDFVNNFCNIRAIDFLHDLEHARKLEQRKRRKHGLEDNSPVFEIIDETKDIVNLFAKIRKKLDDWEVQYRKLVTFKQRYGHCRVPFNWKEDKKLGTWVSIQRRNKEKLNRDRFNKLDEIGFDWDPAETFWNEMYQQLVKYIELHGNSNVPQNTKLGKWCHDQRINNYTLSKEEVKKLNNIGFIWNPNKYIWEQNYRKLKEYKEKYGHTNVPRNWKYNTVLANWVRNQRREKNNLSNWQIRKLNDIEFIWNPRQHAWETMYKQLKDFKEKNGHCNVPLNNKTISLGRWVRNQRKSKLNKYQIKKLNNIGFIWDINSREWDEMYNELAKYKEKYGNCNVPLNYKENSKLGKWVYEQRNNKNKLTNGQINRLEELKFDWKYIEDNIKESIFKKWDEMYLQIIKYRKEHGTSLIPSNFKENKQLGNWVRLIRNYKYCLTNEMVKKLDEIYFYWNHANLKQIKQWQYMFNKLKEYKEKYGNCNVPSNWNEDKSLGVWVWKQRKRKKYLHPEQLAQLNRIGFEWHSYDSSWDEKFNELKIYKEKYGDCNVKQKWKENPSLGNWVCRMRRIKAKLSREQIEKLDALGFDWNPKMTKWNKRYSEVLEYKNKYGHCNIAKSNSLGQWLYRQLCNKNKLTAEQIEKMELLQVEWITNIKD